MRLPEYRHLLPDAVLWTRLPDGLEQAYWSSTATRRDVLNTDTAGLIAFLIGRVILHGSITWKHGHCAAGHINTSIHVFISILQLIWMRKWPSSYLKHRTWINLSHRARHWAEWGLAERTALGQFTHFVHPPPDSWSTCFSVSVQRSLWKAMAQLNHPLPVIPLLLVSTMSLLDAMLWGPGHARHILQYYKLQNKTQQLCHMLHSAYTAPWSLVDRMAGISAEPLHCTPGYMEYVAVFTVTYHIVLLLPLGLTFLLDRASKAAFLNSLGSSKPQWARQLLDRYKPTSWCDVLLAAWLCLSLPWMAVTVVCRLIGAG